jgi:hypothetical protein
LTNNIFEELLKRLIFVVGFGKDRGILARRNGWHIRIAM